MLNNDLTKTDEIILNRSEPWKRMGYHNLQKTKKHFFEKRKIYLLFSAILMVALRGVDCRIFCKMKTLFLPSLVEKKETWSIYHEPWEHMFQDK